MSDHKQKQARTRPRRIKLTARLTLAAYDALCEIQRRHRRKTGKQLPAWKILDSAIIAYAKRQGIEVGG